MSAHSLSHLIHQPSYISHLQRIKEPSPDSIERYVEQVIESKGLVKAEEEKQDIRLLLSRLFFAVGMYSMLTPEQNYEVAKWIKIIGEQFSAKVRLKEGKKRKRKEKSSPTPLSYKEIENPKEVQKNNTHTIKGASPSGLEERKAAFHAECHQFDEQYGRQMVDDFYVYWSEENQKDQQMLWEYQPTWSTAKRLYRWSKSPTTTERKSATMRLERTKSKSAAPVSSKEQQAQTARRAEANSRLEEQIAQAKAEAVPYEEYRRRLSEKFKTEK